jgi:hypothetical protein
MDKFPVGTRKRRVIEMCIRLIDITCYFVVVISGVFALFFTPNAVKIELYGFEWMIGWWASFLLVGGLLGLIGRITTIWIIEPAADVAAFIGITMYFAIVGVSAFSSLTAIVTTCFVSCAGLGVARRYLELQLFGSDPNRRDWRSRIEDAFQRRIPNVPPRG